MSRGGDGGLSFRAPPCSSVAFRHSATQRGGRNAADATRRTESGSFFRPEGVAWVVQFFQGMSDPKTPRPERSLTDESLRTERDNSDRAIVEASSKVEADANEVVQLARDTADAIVGVARGKADGGLASASAASLTEVAGERAIADRVLRDERASEDAILRLQREEQVRVLRRLLPLEREKTDRHLLSERARSDDAVANRDDFLSVVSHDLRNLLSGIVMSAATLSRRADDGDEGAITRATTEKIQRYAARMKRLIGDLEDVSSIDGGRLAVERTRGDLTLVIVEALETFEGVATASSISLGAEHLAGRQIAEFDEGRILQVLANLIGNAIKFTAPGGVVRVGSERVKDSIRVCVRDNGPGIREELLEKIFGRFWQVGKDDRRGLGLGLYISRAIIEAHGGAIWAESKLGEGSRFCFTLPAIGAPSASLRRERWDC